MARLATTQEKLVASGPNLVTLPTPQVATSSPALRRMKEAKKLNEKEREKNEKTSMEQIFKEKHRSM